MARRSTRGRRLPTSWSASRWGSWSECPRKYEFSYIAKEYDEEAGRMMPIYPQKTSPAMERGNKIHKLMEGFLKGEVRGVPNDLKKISGPLRKAKRLGAAAEEPWTLTASLDPTTWDDWSGAWLRAKTDAHLFFEEDAHLSIVDLKTGRVKPYVSQREIYAVMGRALYPQAETISAELWFSDHGLIDDGGHHYDASEADALTKKWVARGNKLLRQKRFPATPSEKACKWCPFRSDRKLANGRYGPCREWRHA